MEGDVGRPEAGLRWSIFTERLGGVLSSFAMAQSSCWAQVCCVACIQWQKPSSPMNAASWVSADETRSMGSVLIESGLTPPLEVRPDYDTEERQRR